MSIQLISVGSPGTTNNGTAATVSYPAPAGITTGSLITLQFLNFFGTTVITPPDSSWVLVRDDGPMPAGGGNYQSMYYHFATGPSDGPWIFSANPVDYMSGCATAWSGANNSTTIDVTAGNIGGGGSTTNLTLSSVTPNFLNEILLASWIFHPTVVPGTLDSRLIPLYNYHDPNNWTIMAGYAVNPTVGVASATYTSSCAETIGTNGAIGSVLTLCSGSNVTVVNNHMDYGY